ncbi:AbiV family abortive infection protein [Nocardioides sp. 616]|uniref:AbiV family abortive infection protein n=1 Tax=Nocardioides sp. 616 TaxID=2268090 RepID=UPI001962B67C|nr:AbiV family abortive infection protein [Nocardioides sp. 616]
MPVRKLPDLSPDQVSELQDALLANADALLTSALAVLGLDHTALARSLAILGLEESGKAIAIHERRVEMTSAPEGEPFRCVWLDELWASHQRKLDKVHGFLLLENYWFGTEPADPAENASALGAIKTWSRRHDRSKQRGFYVDLGSNGTILSPADVADEEALRDVIAHVHQIGWQIRLGEHIEGKRQDEQVAGMPPATAEDLAWMKGRAWSDSSPAVQQIISNAVESLKDGTPGEPLNNAEYRFNPPSADRTPFRNVGKPGYEAETRELLRLEEELDRVAERDK